MKKKKGTYSVQDKEKNQKRFESLSAEEQQRVLARREARKKRREQEVRRQKLILLGGGLLAALILTVGLCAGIGRLIKGNDAASDKDKIEKSQQ